MSGLGKVLVVAGLAVADPTRPPLADPEQGVLFSDGADVAKTCDRNRGHKVSVRRDPTGRGYALFDVAGRRLFGTLRFSTEAAAETYLAQANREARWVKWYLVRSRRPKVRPNSRGSQLELFGDE